MIVKEEDFVNKFSVQVIGEHDKLSGFEKVFLNDELMKFVGNFEDLFSEGVLVADIRFKKGHHNEGKYRGVPLAYVKVRFSTDKGMFVANKENWGVGAAVHDTLNVLYSQIRDSTHRKKEKTHLGITERKLVET